MANNRHGIHNTLDWYLDDWIHLSPEGYGRVTDAYSLPVWVTIKDGGH